MKFDQGFFVERLLKGGKMEGEVNEGPPRSDRNRFPRGERGSFFGGADSILEYKATGKFLFPAWPEKNLPSALLEKRQPPKVNNHNGGKTIGY